MYAISDFSPWSIGFLSSSLVICFTYFHAFRGSVGKEAKEKQRSVLSEESTRRPIRVAIRKQPSINEAKNSSRSLDAGDDGLANEDATENTFERALEKLIRDTKHDSLPTPKRNGSCADATTNRTRKKSEAIGHCQQMDDWDCGVTCIHMLIRWLRSSETLRYNHRSETEAEMELHNCIGDWGDTTPLSTSELLERSAILRYLDTQSIWTIDLVMLLEKMRTSSYVGPDNDDCFHSRINSDFLHIGVATSLSYLFCSNKFGAADDYRNYLYYEQSFHQDSIRVTRQFEHAISSNLPILRVPQLPFDRIVYYVSTHSHLVAIILVDNCVFLRRGTGSYSGHYVLLCGVSYDPSHVLEAIEECPPELKQHKNEAETTGDKLPYCLVLKNPALDCASQFVMSNHLEAAWRANGTDEDIIFIAQSCH